MNEGEVDDDADVDIGAQDSCVVTTQWMGLLVMAIRLMFMMIC